MLALFGGPIALALVLTACGGDDDDDTSASDASSTTTATTPATPAPSITTPLTLAPVVTTPPPVVYVTEGASVMVSNASRVDGAAGRLSDRLATVGFVTVAPGNFVPDQLDVSKIYYLATNPAAKSVADSLYLAFGGGAIEVLELPTPPPVDSGSVGEAGVLVAMGNDIADKSLEELQGLVAPSTSAAPSSDATGSDTSSSGDSSSDASTPTSAP